MLNTALAAVQSGLSPAEARQDRAFWGRLVESAVGAHLVNSSAGTRAELFYWRDRGREVDFVLRQGKRVVAIEVKSGRARDDLAGGMEAFAQAYRPHRILLVGGDGIPLEEFLLAAPARWVGG